MLGHFPLLVGLVGASAMVAVMPRVGLRVPDATHCPPESLFDLVESIPTNVSLATKTTTTAAWLQLIGDAKETLDAAIFYITLLDGGNEPDAGLDGVLVFDAMVAASKRGVRVRIAISSPTAQFPDDDLFKMAEKAPGLEFVFVNMTALIGAGVMHSKYMVADAHSLYLGSANFDWRSLTQVKELGVRVRHCPLLAGDLLKIFDTAWLVGKTNALPVAWPLALDTTMNVGHPAAISLNSQPATVFFTASPPRLCPLGRTPDLSAILALIGGATATISLEVMDYLPLIKFSYPNTYWPDIDDAMRAAAFRGVKLQLLVSYWQYSSSLMVPYLRSLDVLPNIEVRLMQLPKPTPYIPYTRVNHAKFLISEQQGLISTSNWSGDYFTTTAGSSFVFKSTDFVADLQGRFSRDWASEYSSPLPPV